MEPQITIQYPRDQQVVAHGHTFILGKIVPSDADLTVDGNPVRVHRRGGFLTVLRVSPGTNTFRFEASRAGLVTSLSTVLQVHCLRQHEPGESPQIDARSVIPQQSCPLGRGEELWASFLATPGCQAFCGFRSRAARTALSEIPHPGGVAAYAGAEEASAMYFGRAPAPTSERESLVVELTSHTGDSTEAVGPEIRTLEHERWVVSRRLAPLRPSPWGPPDWWLPEGCPVKVRGAMGNHLLLERQGVLLGWGRDLEPYDGAPPEPVRLSAPVARVSADAVLVQVTSPAALPHRVVLSRDRRSLDVALAGGMPAAGLPAGEPAAHYTQDGGATHLTIDLSETPAWGYRCRWTAEGLEVLVRKPPRSGDLTGMLICLDPGHGPQPGAIGPTGIREQSVNLALAVELERCLTRKGARVILTRRGPRGPSLAERVAVAEEAGADVLLSLHHNAVPDGVDPYLNMGTNVYYFHEHYRSLAQRLQEALAAELGLGDKGARWGDFALCRGTVMPSVLLEPAFMISPDHEALVITRDYRRRCCEAISDGLQVYLREAVK